MTYLLNDTLIFADVDSWGSDWGSVECSMVSSTKATITPHLATRALPNSNRGKSNGAGKRRIRIRNRTKELWQKVK